MPACRIRPAGDTRASPSTDQLADTGGRSRADPGSHPGGEPDDPLLMLLAKGVSDAAIARQLGVSDRTLRRRIAALEEQLSAAAGSSSAWWRTGAAGSD